MSENCFSVKIEEPNKNILHIENCVGDNIRNIDIVQSGFYNIQIDPCMSMLPSDFVTIVDAEIASFISAGSGISISSNPSGMIISASPITSGNFQFLAVNNVPVSLSGHKHLHEDILNFVSGVSGLLPVKSIAAGSGISVSSVNGNYLIGISGEFGLNVEQVDDRVSQLLASGSNVSLVYDDQNNILTIGTYGLQPSGNYSLDGHQHLISDINNLQNELDAKQPSGNYSLAGHNHAISDISDFNSGVSGLLPPTFDAAVPWSPNHTVADGTRYLVNDLVYENGRLYRANYENESIPTSSTLYWTDVGPGYRLNIDGRDIQNIPYPVKNIISGSGISVSNNSGDFTIAVSGQFGLTGEQVDDRVNDLLIAGPNILLSYDDLANNLTISTSGLQPSGNYSIDGHSHTSSDVTDFNSSVSGLLTPYATLYSPSFSGIPTVPTAASGTNSNQIASTEFVRTEISNLIDSAPATLDTLNELAAALGDDANFATTVASGLGQKANIVHSHIASDITDFNSSVSGLLPITDVNGGSYVDVIQSGTVYNISVTGLQPSGNYANSIHSHVVNDISDFTSGVSGLLPSVSGSGYVNSSFTNNIYTISVTGLQPSGNYANSIHSHVSSDITDFNSSVSGLIPVKNILAGSGIVVSSTSGIYTIDADISGTIIETIQDNLGSGFLVADTGVKLTYNDSANTLTLANLHTEINELSLEPQGFVNRLDSVITFNDSTRTFTIAPSGSSYDVYIEGVKVTKTTSESLVIGSGTALNYIHFDTSNGLLSNKTTPFNFDTDVPIAFIHWNSDINQSTFFGEERHGIRMDSSTHKWIHNTFGMQYISGLSIGGYTLLGNGSSNSHAQIDISDGVLYQEDIIINIADGNNGVEFTQQLSPIAYIPVYYHSGTTGQWIRDVATPYPLKYNATRAQYNLYSGGTWTTPNVTNNRYFAMWIVATNDINDPVLAIMGQREDSSLGSADNNNNWGDINLTNIPTNELRPLYRLIFVTNDTFTNTPKSSLQTILDIRKSIITSTYGVSQNDHGGLFGLGDDDHSQYVHINEARSISANHTFTNGLTISSGLLSGTSGNFNSLSVNSVQVSVSGHSHTANNITDFSSSVSGLLPSVSGSGYVNSSFNNNVYTISVNGLQPSGNYANASHTHTISDISDFNTGVSGLLPTVANSGDNRILTSTGSSVGVNAENNLTFDGSTLNVDGNLVFDSFTESVVAIGNSSTAVTLSLSSGTVQTCTLTNNCVFTMPTPVAGKSFTLFLNTGTGSYTASFTSVLWNDSSPPTITTTASKIDILSFISDGTYWYGSYSQNYGS